MLAMITGLKLGRGALIGLLLAALLAVAGIGAWRASSTLDGMIEKAATKAEKARDAHWRAEIAEANAVVARAAIDQAAASARADAAAHTAETRLQTDLKTLETANAALKGGDRCGLDADRVRLLFGTK